MIFQLLPTLNTVVGNKQPCKDGRLQGGSVIKPRVKVPRQNES